MTGLLCHGMEWFFREQHESDQGIDAIVEKAPASCGTGRLLAIQIKSGQSYFREPTPSGWVHRFDPRLKDLWLGHALPVILVLVNLDNGVAYWERVSIRTIVPTGNEFKIIVPRAQIVTEADSEWTDLASGLEAKALHRFEWALAQLPPSVQQLLKAHEPDERPDVALLASHLAAGNHNPRGTVQSLLITSPSWISRQATRAWHAIACYAAEHEVFDLSAEAHERVAESSETPGRFLATAAANVMHTDIDRAKDLLRRAGSKGDSPLLVTVVDTLLTHPADDAAPRVLPQALLGDSAEIRASLAAQSLLYDQAGRIGDLDSACHHAQLALAAAPENSSAMTLRAQALIRRSQGPHQHPDDLPTAIELLETALEQRRTWGGNTFPVIWPLLAACHLSGQFGKLLRHCLPSPQGSATTVEAENPHVRRAALGAVRQARRPDLLSDLASRLGDSIQDRVAKLRVGLLQLTAEEEAAVWHQGMDQAFADQDYPEVAMSAVSLANLGEDARPQLEALVQQSIIPASCLDLVGALLTAREDLDLALPQLRSLARRDPVASEYLIVLLRNVGREVEAARACAALYDHSRDPSYLIRRAECLIAAGHDTAEQAATQAITSTPYFPHERADLLNFLASREANHQRWYIAEKHLMQAVALTEHPSPVLVWNLALAQVRQGRPARAANTLDKYRPGITDRDQADLWYRANATTLWDQTKASQAFAIASRVDDPQLAAAIFSHLVRLTHAVDDGTPALSSYAQDASLEARRLRALRPVPASLHRQAFEAMHQLVTDYGDQSGLTIHRGAPEDLITLMTDMQRRAAERDDAFNDLFMATQLGNLPRGMLAHATRHGLTTLLVQRAFGPLVAAAAEDQEHELEMHAAQQVLGQSVVIDAATAVVLTGLSTQDWLAGQFNALHASAGTMWDIHRAAIDARGLAGSPGTVGWSRQSQSMTFWRLDDAEFTRQLRRTQGLEDFTDNLAARNVNGLTLFNEFGPAIDSLTWLEPIQLAHNQGTALWSDDLGLRRLARFKGVPCFSTSALIDVLRDRAIGADSTTQEKILARVVQHNRELALDMVVDIALHLDDLLYIAEKDNWQPHSAALVLSRPSWWAWQADPFEDLEILYKHITAHNPDSLPTWQHAAMLGAGRAHQPGIIAATLLARIALMGYGREPSPHEAIEAARRARLVATELELPDPLTQLPAVVISLARTGKCSDPEEIINAVLTNVEQ